MNTTKVTRQAKVRKLAQGVAARFPTTTKFTIGGEEVEKTDLVNMFQVAIDSTDATAAAKSAYEAAIGAEQHHYAALQPTLRLFEKLLVGQFGDSPKAASILAEFGLVPRKVKAASVTTKAGALVKNKATRAARHTAGSKQKAQIKGVTPEPAPPAPAPATNVPPNGALTHT